MRLYRLKKDSLLHLPKLVAVLMLLVTVIPTHVPGFGGMVPMVEVMSVYYWSIYRPALMPAWFVFGYGLLQDILYATFLGVTALTNTMVRVVVLSQRKFFANKPFIIIWAGFMVFSLVVGLVKWLFFMMLAGEWIFSGAGILQWVLSITLYPAVHWLFNRIFKALPPAVRHAQ